MTEWTFRSFPREGRPRETAVKSADHAVELLMKRSGWTEYGRVYEFQHAEAGVIICIANNLYSSIEFIPCYDSKTRSRVGSRIGIRIKPVSEEPLLFESGGQGAEMPPRHVLPLIKVIRALKKIIENREFPGDVLWTEPLPGDVR